MIFNGRNLKDWQEQVWDAKEKIYQETKNMSFKEYMGYIQNGVSSFLEKSKLRKELLPTGYYKIVEKAVKEW